MKIEDLSLFLANVSLFKGLNSQEISDCLRKVDFKIKDYKKKQCIGIDKKSNM